jgi:hypothetical protein
MTAWSGPAGRRAGCVAQAVAWADPRQPAPSVCVEGRLGRLRFVLCIGVGEVECLRTQSKQPRRTQLLTYERQRRYRSPIVGDLRLPPQDKVGQDASRVDP